MKNKSKLLTLLLIVALLCGLFAVIGSSAATPEGGVKKTYATPFTSKSLDNNKIAEACFANSGLVTATDGQQRFRYLATSALKDGKQVMNDGTRFFQIGTPFDREYATADINYFSYEMDVSFEGIPATVKMGMNVRYNPDIQPNGYPTEGGHIDFTNVNGKLAISAGGKTYPTHFDAGEWVHIAWVVDTTNTDTSKWPATLYINGDPFYTYDVENSTGFVAQKNVFKTGDLRLWPNKEPSLNVPGSTLLFQNYQSYVFGAESEELAAFAKGENSMRVAAGTYRQVVYNNDYVYPSSAKTALASVGDTKYATVEEALAAANGATATLLAPTAGTTRIDAPCVIDTSGKAFDYATSLTVTKEGDVLTFSESENVATFVFTLGDETLGTKTYGLGATPDVTASGYDLFWDISHMYHGTAWTVDGATADAWSMPTVITEEHLGETVTVDLAEAQQVFATLDYTDGKTLYYYVKTDGTTGVDMSTSLKTLSTSAANGPITVIYRASVTNANRINIGSEENKADIYIDLNGQDLGVIGEFFSAKTVAKVHIYSSKPGAVVRTEKAFAYNYSRDTQYTVGTVVKDDVWYSGDNLTVYATALFTNGTYQGNNKTYTYTVNGGTYYISDSGVAIADANANLNVSLNDATFHIDGGSLISSTNAARTANATISNCDLRFASGTSFFGSNFLASGSVTVVGTKIYGAQVTSPKNCTVTLDRGTVLTTTPADGVQLASGKCLVRCATEESDTVLYRVIDVRDEVVTLIRAIETNPVTGEVLDSETTVWLPGTVLSTGIFNRRDYHYTHVATDPTKVLVPQTWVTEDGSALSDTLLLASGTYTVKPATYEERVVSFTITDCDGNMTLLTEGTEAELHAATETTTSGRLFRLYTDFAKEVNPLTKEITLKGANTSFDMNGHILGAKKTMSGLFYVSSAGRSYVYSSRPGAAIQINDTRVTEDLGNGKYNNWGAGFAFASAGDNNPLTVGRTSDGKTFPRNYLTIYGGGLLRIHGADYIIDSITYNMLVPDNNGQIQFQSTGGTLELVNCDMNAGVSTSLIGARSGNGKCKVTFKSSNVSVVGPLTGKHPSAPTFTDDEVVFENSVLLTTSESSSVTPEIPVTLGEGTKTNFFLKNENIRFADGTQFARTSDGVAVFEKTTAYEVTANAATATWRHGDIVLAAEAWKVGSIPTFGGVEAFGDFYFSAAKAKNPIEASRDYNLKLKSRVSKLLGNLTLYSDISFNIYQNDPALRALTVTIPDAENSGATKTLTLDTSRTAQIGEETYDVYTLKEISPKDLTKTFVIALTLENDGKTYTYEVTTSLAVYAESVLKNADESEEGKILVAALIRYVKETALYFKTAMATEPVMIEIERLLGSCNYNYATWQEKAVYDLPAGNTLLTGAALNLGNNPGFFFTVGAGVTEVTVEYNGKTLVFAGEDIKQYGDKDGILVNSLCASEFYDTTITVTATKDGVTETVYYNLDTYIHGVMEKSGLDAAPAYADALYAYSVAAKNYLAR